MAESDYYEVVRQKLKLGPLYAPNHKKIFELMKLLWNEDEIKLLSHFESADKGLTLRELEKISGMPRAEIKKILKIPLKKATISKLGSKYYLLPIVPGIFEQYFIRRQDSEENLRKASEIYRFLFKEFLPNFFMETNFKLFRPLLPYGAEEKLIKVDESLDYESQVLPYELVRNLIDSYDTFSTVPCQCRMIGHYTGEPCELVGPELGCFLAGTVAETAIKGGAPQMTKEEAIEFLKKTEKAGLVHSCVADTSVESSLFICNCCSCHCGALMPAKNHRYYGTIKSNYIPEFNNELCTKCETCLKKCQMGAIYHKFPEKQDSSDERMYVREDYCIGCGVCAWNCPNNAIKLVKVRDNIPKEKHRIGNRTFLELLI